MKKIMITRESVCSQDDQTNDLDLLVEVSSSDDLRGLVEMVLRSKFLQFSSSYKTLTGFVGEMPIVSVTTDFVSSPKQAYLIPPESLVEACIAGKKLEFRLQVGSNNSFQG